MDLHAKKLPGGNSVEYNPLHISIPGRVFSRGKTDPETCRNRAFWSQRRLIDEKDPLKRTPWYLAILKDSERRVMKLTLLIAKRKPSGYVKSLNAMGAAKNGFQIAEETGSANVKQNRRYVLSGRETGSL